MHTFPIKRKLKSLIIRLWQIRILPGTKNYSKVIVLSRSRTGSNLLINLLNSHPNICFSGEIFRDMQDRSFDQIYNSVFSVKPPFIKAVGFKIFYYHPEDVDSKEVWERLINEKDIKVIHLKRENILRTLVSRKIAEENDFWTQNSKRSKISNKQISLSRDECITFFEKTRNWEQQYDELFRDHPKIEVFYESLVNGQNHEELGRIQSFLGVKVKNLKTNLRKQNPENLAELIVNYDELEEGFRNTSWEHFFRT